MGAVTTLTVIGGADAKTGGGELIPVIATPDGGVMPILPTVKVPLIGRVIVPIRVALIGEVIAPVEKLPTLPLAKLISVAVIGVAFALVNIAVLSAAIMMLNTTCFIDFLWCG